MNLIERPNKAEQAFTLAETGVAVGVAALLGLVFFQVLQSGLTLSAKNAAVNTAHEEARDGIQRLTRDLHASVSVPQLRDTSFNVVDSTLTPAAAAAGATPPTAAGVSFQNVVPGSPDYVWQDPGNPSLIMIKDGITPPTPGMRLIIPAWGMEDDIAKVTASGTAGHSNVFTTQALETSIKNPKTFGGTSYAITYYTNRVMYCVQNGGYVADSKGDFNLVGGQYVQVTPGTGAYHYENGELHYYQQRSTSSNPSVAGTLYWKDTAIVARFLSNPKPFSVPLNRYGGPDNKYVKVQVSARDPKSTNRGYIATSSLLETKIDYRSRLTVFQ